MKRFFYVAAALSLLAVSCKEEIKEDVLEVVSSSTVVGVEGTTQAIKFTTNNPWSITCDQTWVTFDKQSGDAGDGAVNMTVAANDTYDGRSAKVTVKAGSKSHVLSVTQFGKTEFGTAVSLSVTSQAQNITIPVISNVEYSVNVSEDSKDWITIVKTKSAPTDGEIVLGISANTELFPRTGGFEIVAGATVQKYVVTQNSDFTPMSKAEAIYLGSVQDIYDEESYSFNTFRQFAVVLSDDADNKVVLALNASMDADKTVVPVGEYSVDATATHAKGTFSLKSTDGHEKYYTCIIADKAEVAIIDGEVSVSAENGVYTITALLQDSAESIHSYSFQGEIAVTDKSFGAECTGFTRYGQYNTYFAGGAQEWSVSLMTSDKDKADNPVFLRNIYLTVYGTSAQEGELPVGEFKYEVPEADESLGKPKGITRANPQTFSFSADNGGWVTVTPADGTAPSLSIAKNDDGTYAFSFSGSFIMSEDIYDDNGEFVETKNTPFSYDGKLESVYLPEPEIWSKPVLDVDTEFTNAFNARYQPRYYGHVFDENNDVFFFGFTPVNDDFDVCLSVSVKGNYVFVPDLRKRYCTTPFGTGTFTFSKTGGDNTLIPLAEGNAPRLYIKNTYTGTVFYITGGSITLTDSKITYNLTAKPKGGDEVKFTGSHDALFYFAMDYTKVASQCTLFNIE